MPPTTKDCGNAADGNSCGNAADKNACGNAADTNACGNAADGNLCGNAACYDIRVCCGKAAYACGNVAFSNR